MTKADKIISDPPIGEIHTLVEFIHDNDEVMSLKVCEEFQNFFCALNRVDKWLAQVAEVLTE